jgi:hypothetical protein
MMTTIFTLTWFPSTSDLNPECRSRTRSTAAGVGFEPTGRLAAANGLQVRPVTAQPCGLEPVRTSTRTSYSPSMICATLCLDSPAISPSRQSWHRPHEPPSGPRTASPVQPLGSPPHRYRETASSTALSLSANRGLGSRVALATRTRSRACLWLLQHLGEGLRVLPRDACDASDAGKWRGKAQNTNGPRGVMLGGRSLAACRSSRGLWEVGQESLVGALHVHVDADPGRNLH